MSTLGSVTTNVQSLIAELRSDGRGWILLSVAVGWFLSIGVRFIFPAMIPFLRDNFTMSLATAGLLYSLLWIAYAIGQLPGGIIGDRIGDGNILLISTLMGAATVLLISASVNVWMLAFGAILFGLLTAPYAPARLVILSNIYSERDGTAIGLTFAAGNIGNTLIPVIAVLIATYLTWRVGFAFSIPLFLLAAVMLWHYVPGRSAIPEADSGGLSMDFARRLVSVSMHRPILIAASVSLFGGFVFQGFTGLYPTYLVDIKGLSPTLAATLFGVFFAVGAVVQVLAGWLSDHWGPGVTLASLYSVIIVGLIALPFVDGVLGLILISVMISGILGYMPVVQTFLAASFPTELKGSGVGLLRTVTMMFNATGPFVVGLFAEGGYFDEVYFVLAGVALIALLFSVGLRSH